MLRSLLILASTAFAAAPVAAATYSATPAVPAAESRIAARDIVWSCGSSACVGSTANSRPLVLCQGLAKKTGPIESFLVDGRPIDPAQLARCNASAKAVSDEALADGR